MQSLVKNIGAKMGYKVLNKNFLPRGLNLIDDLDSCIDRKSVKIVLDVGANAGQSMEWMLKAFPQAKIHCFEPVEVTYQKLQQIACKYPRVICHKMALGAEDGLAMIYTDSEDKVSERNSFVYCGDENIAQQTPEQVSLTSMESFCIREKIGELPFVKLDVEGYELEAIKGASGLLEHGAIHYILCEASLLPQRKTQVFIGTLIETMARYQYEVAGIYNQDLNSRKNRIDFVNALFRSPLATMKNKWVFTRISG